MKLDFNFSGALGHSILLCYIDVTSAGMEEASYKYICFYLYLSIFLQTFSTIYYLKKDIHIASEHSWSTNASLFAQYGALTRRPCSRLFWLSIRVYCDEWTNKAAKYPAGLVRGSSRTVFRSQPSQPAILTLDRSPVKAGGVVSDTCLWCSLSIS